MRTRKWLLLLLTVVLALAAVIVPAWIIQPFRPQQSGALQFAMRLRTWSPMITLLLLVAVIWYAAMLWKGGRWWGRTALVLLSLLTAGAAWLARQNHFEWMFHPLPGPQYASADAASFVDASDLVLAVEKGGEAAAYPIRLMGYHHIVHDVVGKIPIVVTY
jgi:hypothetical protein